MSYRVLFYFCLFLAFTGLSSTVTAQVYEHDSEISAVAINGVGEVLVTLSKEGTVNIKKGKDAGESFIECGQQKVVSISINSFGDRIAVALENGLIKVCDQSTRLIKELFCEGVTSVAMSRSGKFLVAGSHLGKVIEWENALWEEEIEGKEEKRTEILSQNKPISSIAISPCSSLVAVGAEKVCIILKRSNCKVNKMCEQFDNVTAIAINKYEEKIYVASGVVVQT